MSDSETPVHVDVDSTNPGQFFACCGLLELADRIWPGAEGWFDDGGFQLRATDNAEGGLASSLMSSIVNCRLTNTMTDEQLARLDELAAMTGKDRQKTPGMEDEKKALEKLRREEPIVLLHPFNLRIDWFLDDCAGGDRYKTWAGQQSVLQIATAMKEATESVFANAPPSAGWLSQTRSGCGLPFNFDSDLGGQGGAIDIGFSFDPLMPVGRPGSSPQRGPVWNSSHSSASSDSGRDRYRTAIDSCIAYGTTRCRQKLRLPLRAGYWRPAKTVHSSSVYCIEPNT